MKLIIKRWFLISVLLTAVFAACTPAAETTETPAVPSPVVETAVPATAVPEENAPGSTLLNTQWTLESFGPTGAEMPVIEGTAVTLQFDANGQAGGSGGCNSFGTTYQAQDNTISFGEITSTLIACTAEGVTEQEQAYLQALLLAHAFTQTENSLTILYDDGQGTLNYVPAVSSSPANEPSSELPPEEPTEVRTVVSERDAHYYASRAFEGQEMAVEISSLDEAARLTIVGEDEMPINHYPQGRLAWMGQLPATQVDYTHAVVGGFDTSFGSFSQLCPGDGGCKGVEIVLETGR